MTNERVFWERHRAAGDGVTEIEADDGRRWVLVPLGTTDAEMAELQRMFTPPS